MISINGGNIMKVKKYEQTYNGIMNELLDIWVDNDKELQKLYYGYYEGGIMLCQET